MVRVAAAFGEQPLHGGAGVTCIRSRTARWRRRGLGIAESRVIDDMSRTGSRQFPATELLVVTKPVRLARVEGISSLLGETGRTLFEDDESRVPDQMVLCASSNVAAAAGLPGAELGKAAPVRSGLR
ncbi:hypothetical protein NG2371_07130 [Nocardia gamkensis]|nr:hypothetical protein [Nocardia gamkensis]